jgi:hypothetical protein
MTMLYLSRLTLNPRQSVVQRDLADCYAMHQRILSGFPNGASEEHARSVSRRTSYSETDRFLL